MSKHAERRSSLLTLSVVIPVAALAIVLLRGSSGDHRGAELALSSPALPAEAVEGDADSSPVITPPRSAVTVAVEESSAAPEVVTLPEPRLVAASWMAARNSAHVVTPEQRLKELVGYREQFNALPNDSFLRYQTMAALAAVAAATHLDEIGQATTAFVLPTELQWEFATGGAKYLFERGKYPAYDLAREAFEEAIRTASAEVNSVGFAFATVPPIPAETIARLDTFVDQAIHLLTRTE
jgi:hypothetical protein